MSDTDAGAADKLAAGDSLAVLIVGMHRSGTSAVSGVLTKLGVATPESLHPADEHNPRGYFEPRRIIDFHESLFAQLGSPSNDPLPLSYDWLDSPVGRAAVDQLADILDEEFAGRPMCLFKDPRICRLMPVWTRALERTGRRAVAVVPCRHPLEVAGSLQAKAGLSRAYSLFMWLQHVVLGERFTRGLPRSFIGYQALLNDWRGSVGKMERELDVVWPRDMMRASPEIDGFLSGALRHHQAQSLDAHDPLHALCARAWEALAKLEANPADGAAQAALDGVAAEIESGVGLFGPLVIGYQRETERLHEHLNRSSSDAKALDQALRHEVEVRDREIQRLVGEEIPNREREIDRLVHDEIGTRDREIERLLRDEIAGRDAIINEHVAYVRERDATILSLTQQQTTAVEGYEKLLEEQRGAIVDRDVLLAKSSALLTEAQRARQTLRRRYEEKDRELGFAQDAIRDRERQIGDFQRYVQDLERERDRLTGEAIKAIQQTHDTHRQLEEAHAYAHEVALRAQAIEQSNSWKLMFALQRVLGANPKLRRLMRVTAKGSWWLATGQFGSKLRERKAAIAAAKGLAPPEPQPDPHEQVEAFAPEPMPGPESEPLVEVAAEAAAEPQVVDEGSEAVEAPARTRPLHVTFLSGEPDTPGHLYRVKRHAEAAEAVGCTTSIVRIDLCHANLEEFRKADLVFIWRAAWDEVNIQAALDAAEQGGAVVVFDIDDLIVEPELAKPEIIDGMRSQRHDTDLIIDYFARMQRTLRAADYGCAPTPYLSEFLQRYTKTIWNKLSFQLPNGFDEDVLRRSRLAARRRRQEEDDGLVRIGYAAGSKTHQADFWRRVGSGRPDHARAPRSAAGAVPVTVGRRARDRRVPGASTACTDQIEYRQIVPLPELPNEVARFDINLAPLEVGNIFCEAKSELKYFEAALVDVPTVASPTEPYRNAIRHGETGFLADTTDEWYAALKQLVQDRSCASACTGGPVRLASSSSGRSGGPQAFLSMIDQALARGRRSARAFELRPDAVQGAASPIPTVPPHDIAVEYRPRRRRRRERGHPALQLCRLRHRRAGVGRRRRRCATST